MPRRASGPKIRYGFIDESGAWAIAPRFDDVGSFGGGLAAASRRARFGYLDRSGAWAIPPRFVLARKFDDGFAWVGDGKSEFRIDRQGERHVGWLGRTVQGRRRLCVGGTRAGSAIEPRGGRWGFTDVDGNVVVEPRCDGGPENPPDYSEGLAVCRCGESHAGAESRYEVLDLAGKIVFAASFVRMGPFREGRALVRVFGAGCGFVDRDGRLVIEARWASASGFAEGRAAVRDRSGAWGFVDAMGTLVIACRFASACDFSEGRALVGADGRFGFAELDGRVGEMRWQRASSFSGGLAVVSSRPEGTLGAIDSAGTLVIPERFRALSAFSEGVARAEPAGPGRAERKVGFLGVDGQWRVPPGFDELGSWQPRILARRGSAWGFVDQSGREVIPFLFARGRSRFFEGLAAMGVADEASPRTRGRGDQGS